MWPFYSVVVPVVIDHIILLIDCRQINYLISTAQGEDFKFYLVSSFSQMLYVCGAESLLHELS